MSLKAILLERGTTLASIEKYENKLKEIDARLSTEHARIDGMADKAFWRAMKLAVVEGKATINVSEVVEAACSNIRRPEVVEAIRERFMPKQVPIAKTELHREQGSKEASPAAANDPEGLSEEQGRRGDNLERPSNEGKNLSPPVGAD